MFSPVVSVRNLIIEVPEGRDVTFISDVHLGFGDRETDRNRERVLIQALSDIKNTTCHLFVVGDLFDFWFDYKTTIPKGHVRTLAMLHDFVDAGIPITYLMGNHDFGHWRYFQEEIGIKVEMGDIDALIGGKRFYISHGDGKASNDRGYLILRSIYEAVWHSLCSDFFILISESVWHPVHLRVVGTLLRQKIMVRQTD
jgi:UDP-2,3-diacylglucosamine hydrolase